MSDRPPAPGGRIITASWAAVAAFAVVGLPDALGVTAFDGIATGLSLGLFFVSLPVWGYAYFHAMARTTRGDDIVVASWVFLSGSAPAAVRRHLLGATAASIVLALAYGWSNPFSVLVPMLPLGLAALWGARHGSFPPRRAAARPRGGRR